MEKIKHLVLWATLFALTACGEHQAQSGTSSGSDPLRGKALIAHYGCGSCHTIAGVNDAYGLVGPPLKEMKQRSYLAGILANTPEHMQQWIMHPTRFNPKTAMPELGVTENDARDIAAYLYSQ